MDTMDTTSTVNNMQPFEVLLPRKNEALNRQQIQLLFSDIENLRNLHNVYTESQNSTQFAILFRRVNQYLDRMDELSNTVLLDEEQLKKFQEDKQYLDKLSFDLAANVDKTGEHHHGFGHHFMGHHGHGHHGKMDKKWHKHHKWMKKGEKHGFPHW